MTHLKQWRRRFMTCSFAVVATSVSLVGPAPAGAQEIQLGAVVSLDGSASFIGIAAQAGMRVAAEMINKDPEGYLGSKSRSIAIDFRNGGATITQVLAIARDFARDPKCLAILGPTYSPQALALGPFAQQAEIPLLIMHSPAADRTVAGNYVFAMAQDGEGLADAAAKAYMQKYPNTRRIGVIYGSDNQGNILIANSVTKAFKASGVEVTPYSLPYASLDFSNAIDAMKRGNAEAVFLAQGAPEITAAVHQAERAGLRIRYIGHGTMAAPTLFKNVGAALDGSIIATDYNPQVSSALNTRFTEAYRKATGNDPDTYSAQGFTTVMIVASAVKSMAGEVTRAKLADALAATKNIDAVVGSGTFSFTGNRTVAPPPALLMVIGSTLTTFKP